MLTFDACVFLSSNLVSWRSKKQQVIAHFSTEAEHCSLAHITVEILWLQSLLKELKLHTPILVIWCDNLSVVHLTKNLIFHARTKHVELDIHFVHEQVISGDLLVTHFPATK